MTIDIDLEDNRTAIKAENASVKKLGGFQMISEPMSATAQVDDAEVDAILAYLKAPPAQGVILLHCHYGEDRTGLLIGLYRVLVQGWTADQAYKEMLAFGFHPSLTYLDTYFRERTHYTGR